MGKANRNRGKRRGKSRRSTSLKGHHQHKKVLTPPFLQMPNLKPVSWQHDGLPDFLWIQTIREETGSLAAANDALDLLDEFVPDPPESPEDENGEGRAEPEQEYEPHPITYLDGRISTFPLVPEARRAEAREALTKAAPWALPDELGHGLVLYPECPAVWLYEDWAKVNHADPEIGTAYLKRLVAPLLDPKGRPSSQVRMIPVARGFKHGKIFLTRGMEVVDLLSKYPTGLNEEDQLHVEQWNRNMWNIHQATSDPTIARAWVRHFWKQNWQISACAPAPSVPPPLDETEPEEGVPSEEGRGRRQPTVAEMQQGFVRAINGLGKDLRAVQRRAEIDIYNPTPDEVKLGLASRMFRLLRHLAFDPDLWTNEMGPHALRPMIDARIITAWLLKQNDPELFQKFKDYGVGKRKLFKLQLEELMDSDDLSSDDDDEALHKRLEAEVNQDVMEEFVKIDLGGSFSGKNIRQMAQEADLNELYSLSYQPLSTEAHGEWGQPHCLRSSALREPATPLPPAWDLRNLSNGDRSPRLGAQRLRARRGCDQRHLLPLRPRCCAAV
jgi:hypothetical protein